MLGTTNVAIKPYAGIGQKGGLMRTFNDSMLPLFIIIAYIIIMPMYVYGQGNPDIPLDESGNIFMSWDGYSLFIFGQVYNREAPS
jgi:hypothetical protein